MAAENLLLTQDANFGKLRELFDGYGSKLRLIDLFGADSKRFDKMHIKLPTPDGDLLLDYSKNLVDDQILEALFALVGLRWQHQDF